MTFDGIQSTYYYLVVAQLPARQMTDDYIVVVYRNGEEVARNAYSIQDYCLSAVSSPDTTDKAKMLARAVATYGAEAQKYFNYNLDDLADEGIERVDLTPIPDTYAPGKDPSLKGIKSVTMSLSLEAQTRLNVTFTPENSTYKYDVSVKKNGKEYTNIEVITLSSGVMGVMIYGTSAQELGTEYKITLTNKSTGASATYSRSVMNCAYKSQSVASMTGVMQALYQYYLAAK